MTGENNKSNSSIGVVTEVIKPEQSTQITAMLSAQQYKTGKEHVIPWASNWIMHDDGLIFAKSKWEQCIQTADNAKIMKILRV